LSQVAEILGDLNPLLAAIGSADGLPALTSAGASLQCSRISDVPSLQRFLDAYSRQLLGPVELPAILQARELAATGQARELIALDREIAGRSLPPAFAAASERVGRQQLRRLRPLRDQRVVQRYLAAVEQGEARGWHTCVYGLVLAVYALPLRQGLANYARHTARSFIESAAGPLQLTGADCQALALAREEQIRATVEAVVLPAGLAALQPV
jgi:urease accessory protein UreF